MSFWKHPQISGNVLCRVTGTLQAFQRMQTRANALFMQVSGRLADSGRQIQAGRNDKATPGVALNGSVSG